MTRELVDQIVKLADNTARAIAFAPIDAVWESLVAFRATLESDLAEAVGADVAAQVGEAFIFTVLKCKAGIESAACKPDGVTLQ